MRKLAFLTAAGYFALSFLFVPGMWARPNMCSQAKPGCGMKCHGDDKIAKCPKKKSDTLQQFFGLEGFGSSLSKNLLQ